MSSKKVQSSLHPTVKKMNISQASTCEVCGNKCFGRFFGAICCAPCKMFFRRNVHYNLDKNKCNFDGQCKVSSNNRHVCRFCRLKKCLSVGMQKELIRASRLPSRPHAVTHEKMQVLPAIYPLDLLRNDRSLLTEGQWSFLSNVVHVYDRTSPLLNIVNSLSVQSTYPLKIRMKIVADNLLNVISSLFRAVGPFVDLLPQFSTLQISDKNELIERHLRTVGGFGGMLILREANVYSSAIYRNSFALHYGSELFDEGLKVAGRHEIDGTVVKLFVAALFFSTCSDVVYQATCYQNRNTSTNGAHRFSNMKRLIEIQNIYIEIMFKYMLYRYGFRDATLRFAALVKNFLDQGICLIKAGEHQMQHEMVKQIRTDMIHTSTLHNERVN